MADDPRLAQQDANTAPQPPEQRATEPPAPLLSPLIVESLSAIAGRLATLAVEDEPLRRHLRALATRFLEITAEPAAADAESPPACAASTRPTHRDSAGSEDEADGQPPRPEADERPREPLPPLTLGQSAPPPEQPIAPPVRWTTPTDADFPIIEARCRLKAEGARWAARRQRLIGERGRFATEIEPRDREIISRAKSLPDCFLWMCHPSGPAPADLDLYDLVAAAFENLAAGLSIVKQVLDEPQLHQAQFEAAIDLLAEAQSALRASIEDIDGPIDSDQLRVFNWLRDTAAENRIFIQRYMRLDDPADPRRWADLAARIEALDATLQEAQRKHKLRRKLLGKVRHKASLIEAQPHEAGEHWRLLIAAVEDLVAGGLPPSNPELRDILLPIVDSLPDQAEQEELPRGFQFVLREIDRYRDASPLTDAAPRTPSTSPQIEEAARLLEGRSVVLIGGERRPTAQQAIEEAFRLSELVWIETREHQSIAGFEPAIARDDVAVVLLAIRWSSHSFGEAKEFCDKHDKPLVRLPGGYNPSQIAVQVLNQSSARLQAG